MNTTSFTGEFETHITVSNCHVERLPAWCAARNIKSLHIVLDAARMAVEHHSQPMLSWRGWGDFDRELAVANRLAAELTAEGFRVVRIKIEAAPSNSGVPQSALEAASQPADRYFEHHLKLNLAPDADLELLRSIASAHSAHLSHNALQVSMDGRTKRFLTQRCMGVGSIDARIRLQQLIDRIAAFGYRPIDIEAEFVVYDSNLALDRGWM
jgi:hypothetical protein